MGSLGKPVEFPLRLRFGIVSVKQIMKFSKGVLFLLPILVCSGAFPGGPQQQGPETQSSETVAKPRKKDGSAKETEQPKIPSQFTKKDRELPPEGSTTFQANATT